MDADSKVPMMAGGKGFDAQEEKAASFIKEFEVLASNRGIWESQWQEIAERIWPSSSGSFNHNGFMSNGQKKTELVFDTTAAIALNRFAAIMDSLLTPRNQTWHRISPTDPAILKNRAARNWYEDVNRLLFRYRYAAKGNYAAQNQQNYKGVGAFGTGALFIDDLKGMRGTRYKALHLRNIYFRENHQGIVDEAFRPFNVTARQCLQWWKKEQLPDAIVRAHEINPDQIFKFLHITKPKDDYEPGRSDFRGMPIGSYYVAFEGKHIVEEGGYRVFPYAISRYEQASDEVYGRSPAMDVLPGIKTLNEMKKTILKQGHRTVDPVLLGHDDGVLDGFSLKPGAYNSGAVNAQGQPLVHTLPVGNLAIGKELMDDERDGIKDVFLVSIFQILAENPQQTATEVLERAKEKGILLAPTMGRQQSEYLGPKIDRELDILSRQGALPPMPQILKEAGIKYDAHYDSPLSRAQRAEEASGLMRTVETALQVVQITQNPEPLDVFNWDVIMPEVADIQGVPARWLHTPEEVAALRQGRQQGAQQQQMIQAAPAAAAMVKAQAVAKKGQG